MELTLCLTWGISLSCLFEFVESAGLSCGSIQTSMWLPSRLQLLEDHPGPIILACEQGYGTNLLINAQGLSDYPLIWFELSPQDVDDEVNQGNRLADALRDRFGSALMTHSLPYLYGINQLKIHLPYLGKFTFAMSNAQFAPRFAEALLELQAFGSRVILQADELPVSLDYPENALVLGADELRLSQEEALGIAKGNVRTTLALQIWKEVSGRHDTFQAEVNVRSGRPAQLVPGPKGLRYPEGFEPEAQPEELLEVLVLTKRWEEALELACDQLPEHVLEVLEEAGHFYHERGMHKQLWALLEPLPETVKHNEVILFWLLSSAFRLDSTKQVREQVEAFLDGHDAPNLRALYGGVHPLQEKSLIEIRRAYANVQNAFTTYQMGLWTESPEESVRLLEESVSLAEQRGENYEKVRNAASLGERLLLQGNYQGAAGWLTWALREFEEHQLSDIPRRLRIINNWAYLRILLGETAGLSVLLSEGERSLSKTYPALAQLFRSTLGDYSLANGQLNEAAKYYAANFRSVDRSYVGAAGLDMVRIHTELGELEEATKIATQAAELTAIESPAFQATAFLAQGIALTFQKPREALKHLEKAMEVFSNPVDAPALCQTVLYLCKNLLLLGDKRAAHACLDSAKQYLSSLTDTGLRLLSGPEKDFREVWNMVLKNQNDLEIRLLGTPEVWLNNEQLHLSPRMLEVLAILAIKKRPLTLEELVTYLYGDHGSKVNLKSFMYKLRQKVPVGPHPYAINVPYQVDAEEIQKLLKQGDVDEAVRLYRGPVLPFSDSPFIRDYDQSITEKLRRAALTSEKADLILHLSETEELSEDLELLEQALAVIEKGDPRAPMLEARVHQIQTSWTN